MGYKKLLGICLAIKESPNYKELEKELREKLEEELRKSENKFDRREY